MHTTRRRFLEVTGTTFGILGAAQPTRAQAPAGKAPAGKLPAGKAPAAKPANTGVRLGVCDWSTGSKGIEALAVAKAMGFDGIELAAGQPEDQIPLTDAALRAEYRKKAKELGIEIASVAMGFPDDTPLVSDPKAGAWLEQTIETARDLATKTLLVAFFGTADLRVEGHLDPKRGDALVERLKDTAPKAAKAGLVLGLENTLSARENLSILDRVQNDSVKVYYDIGNSTNRSYDVPAEIRLLGDRICQIHFKDGDKFLGEGKVNMAGVADAMRAIHYKGWVFLETAMPSGNRDADFKRNATFVRQLLG